MPSVQGIQALRNKLHVRMDQLRRNRVGNQPETKDDLLEERRKQRGLMRDRRRKETKEKIRLEREAKGGKDDKGDKKGTHQKGLALPKVGTFSVVGGEHLTPTRCRTNSLYLNLSLVSQVSHFLSWPVHRQARSRGISQQHQIRHWRWDSLRPARRS